MDLTSDTAKRIISAATHLFAAHGYDAVSVKQICEMAQVNIAAIHYHFESKENLYQHLLSQFASTRLDFARKTLQIPQNLDEFKVGPKKIYFSERPKSPVRGYRFNGPNFAPYEKVSKHQTLCWCVYF